jgi:chromosome transmission fidelity protein 4
VSVNDSWLLTSLSEHSIKIVNLVDTSQVVLFKGHSTSVRSIAFDPQGKFLASSGLDGKIRVWDTTSASGSSLAAVLTDVPLAKDNDQIMLKASWHPSGNYLAIPGFKVINVYNRNSWTLDKTLQDGGHEANVSIVTFSHDGRYLASCGMDLKIFIWDFEKGETIEFTDTSRPLCSLEWNFHDEAIIATNWFGQLIIWDSPLSEALPDAAPLSKSLDDVSMDLSDELTLDSSKRKGPSEGENKKKKLKKSSTIEGVSEKNVFSEDDLENEADLSETVIPDFDEFSDRPRTQEEAGGDNIEIAAPVHLQEPIQIGSTPLYNGRRFLAWNLIGSIDSQETETHNVIQIQFSDVSFHKPLRFNDHFGFQLGAIGILNLLPLSKRF